MQPVKQDFGPRLKKWITSYKETDAYVALQCKAERILEALGNALKNHRAKQTWWDRWGRKIVETFMALIKIVAGLK